MGTGDLICEAIRRRRLLQFSYGDHLRVVEPHVFGQDSAGRDLLSAYLVGGYSESQKKPYWRFYLLSNIPLLTMLDDHFPGPRQGYNPKDPRMRKVYCCLEPDDASDPKHNSVLPRMNDHS
jgi:hypothetical protein